MRRTPILGGLALALLLALLHVPAVHAAALLTLRGDGSTFVRQDRLLPPAAGVLADARAPRVAA
ncbi:MAG: hypothetical protein ACRDLN_10280, partial [Solirubrobacteraceae bacterium]